MGEIILAELKCDHCKRYFKRTLHPDWKLREYVKVICKYCGGHGASVTHIYQPGQF